MPVNEDNGVRRYVPDTFEDSMIESVIGDDFDDETMTKVIMPMLDIYLPPYRKIYDSNKKKKLR